jgi:hypothetical protein
MTGGLELNDRGELRDNERMRSADRPGAGDIDDEVTLPWERDDLAERLLRLPRDHPSAPTAGRGPRPAEASDEPDEWWAGVQVRPGKDGRERAGADADGAENAGAEPGELDEDAAGSEADAGEDERSDAGGGGQPERAPGHHSGRGGAGELAGGGSRDPYRPWFATGGPGEPWFAAGPDE